jgi:hypothetical protein
MISLNGSLRTCKVEQGWANKIQSARFQDAEQMMCPNWQGQDNLGRFVHPDSFYTKVEGCSLPMDRVLVENYLRPMYMTYINLDASGFKADMYGESCSSEMTANNMECYEADIRSNQLNQLHKIGGNFGLNPSQANLTIRCPTNTYTIGQEQFNNQFQSELAEIERQSQASNITFEGFRRASQGGCGPCR